MKFFPIKVEDTTYNHLADLEDLPSGYVVEIFNAYLAQSLQLEGVFQIFAELGQNKISIVGRAAHYIVYDITNGRMLEMFSCVEGNVVCKDWGAVIYHLIKNFMPDDLG